MRYKQITLHGRHFHLPSRVFGNYMPCFVVDFGKKIPRTRIMGGRPWYNRYGFQKQWTYKIFGGK